MLQLFKSKAVAFKAAMVAMFLAMFTGHAFAGGGAGTVDVSAVVSAIEAAATPIGAIGAAVLIVLVAIKVYKWVRRAM